MAVELATAYINLAPSFQGGQAEIAKELNLDKVAAEAGESAGKKLSGGLVANTSDVGKKLVASLGLATLGAIALSSAVQVEDANNIIIRSTGATGAALDGLKESFRNITANSGAPLEQIATTLSEVSQRTGLTGKALESLTAEVISFNRNTKDTPITVQALTSALAGFNVPADDMGKILDHLFVISQKTGVPLAELVSTLQTAGPVARQFGFSVEFTAGFLAQLNKAGVDAGVILPGLKKAFAEFAQAGKDPAAGLRETLTSMQDLLDAGKLAEARQLAIQLFGPRGVGLVDAAIAGKVSIDALNESIDTSGDGILETAKKTGTLAGALGILRNNLKLAFAEFATPALEAANEALRSILPTIRDIGEEFAALPTPVKVATVGIGGLIATLGPLGQLGEGLDGLSRIASGLGTGFQLAAVRGLELVESLKAVRLAQFLTAGAMGLVLGGLAAVSFALVTGRGRYEEITDAAQEWGRTTVLSAQAGGNALKELTHAQSVLVTRVKELRDAARQDDRERRSQNQTTQDLNASQAQYADLILILKKRHDALTPEIKRLREEQKIAAVQAEATRTSLDTYKVSLITGGDATSAFAGLTDDAKRALLDFQDTLLALAGGSVGYQQALANIAEAELKLFLLRSDPKADPKDVAQAERDLTTARLQGVQAAKAEDDAHQKLVDQLIEGAVSYDAEIARLNELIRVHPENAAGYQLEIDKLQQAKRDIDNLPKTASTTYTVEYDPGPLNTLIFQLAQIPGGIVQQAVSAGSRLPFAAEGGIFSGPFIGGEAGIEAVLPLNDPARSLQIISQTGLFSAAPASASTVPAIGALHLHADTVDPVKFGEQMVTELRVAAIVGAF